MRRSRLTTVTALTLFVSGLLLIAWAGSGAAAVAAASPHVTVTVADKHVLTLACAEPTTVGHRDRVCQTSNAGPGPNLQFDFSRGWQGKAFGLQPGSLYVFGDVMYITNIWHEAVDVRIRVEQEQHGNLYEVLRVRLSDAAGSSYEMFPPPSGQDGRDKTLRLQPDDAARLSFAFAVDDLWASRHGKTFTDQADRFELTGAVIVALESDESETPPGEGGQLPPNDPPPAPPVEEGSPTQDDEFPPDPPGSGPDDSAGDAPHSGEIDQPPPQSGPLPFTGGATWPYIVLGMLLMVAGVWLYVRSEPDAAGR